MSHSFNKKQTYRKMLIMINNHLKLLTNKVLPKQYNKIKVQSIIQTNQVGKIKIFLRLFQLNKLLELKL